MPLRVIIREIPTHGKTTQTFWPNDRPGTIADNPEGRPRDIYLFQCNPDGNSSSVLRSKVAVDIDRDPMLDGNIQLEDPNYTKQLRKNDMPLILNVTTDSGRSLIVTLRHI